MKPDGYVVVSRPGDPRGRGAVLEHLVIVEAVLGKPLPPGAQVHHVDGNGANNAHSNLVICEDQAYHQLLHRRARALAACGNPDALICGYCHQFDDPSAMTTYTHRKSVVAYHKPCAAAYRRDRRAHQKRLLS